jgi:alpha-1,2-mannosyltransferase
MHARCAPSPGSATLVSGAGTADGLAAARSGLLLVIGVSVLALSLAAFCVYSIVHAPGWTDSQVDLQVYRAGGLIARHVSPPYSARLPSPLYDWGGLPNLPLKFTYPPFAAAVFGAVSFVPAAALPKLSVAANLVLLVTALWFTFAGLGYQRGRLRAAATLLAAALLLWSEPVLRTIYLGQVNLALMALIIWDLTGRSGRVSKWWRGAGVGIAAGIKLVPLIFIPYLLLTRRFRQAAVACCAFLATVAVGFAVLPGDSARWWLDGMFFQGSRTGFLAWEGNQSLRALLARLTGDVASSKPLWLVVAALTIVAGLACAAILHRAGHAMAGLLVCALTGLLASPVSWDHHWVWVAPGVAVAARYAVRACRQPGHAWAAGGFTVLAAGLLAVFAAWPGGLWTPPRNLGLFSLGLIWSAPETDPVTFYRLGDRPWYAEYHWHGIALIAGNAFVLAGAAVLAITLACVLVRGIRRHRAAHATAARHALVSRSGSRKMSRALVASRAQVR